MSKQKTNKSTKTKQLHYGMRMPVHIQNKLLSPTVNITNHRDGSIKTITNASASDISVLLLLFKYQNNTGTVKINISDLCNELYLSKSTIYNSFRRLEERQYIIANPNGNKFWTVRILDCYYLSTDDFKQKPYINLNKKFLFTKEFKSLKVNAQKICLYLLSQKQINNFKTFNIYMDTIKQVIGLQNDSLIKEYLESIKQFFPHIFKKGKDKIKKVAFSASEVLDQGYLSEKTIHCEHVVQAVCKRFAIKFENFNDLMVIINQYTYKVKFNKLLAMVKEIILKYKEVNPVLINTILSSS